jgi:hypothetical protein
MDKKYHPVTGKYMATKTGCNVAGIPLRASYNEATREVTFIFFTQMQDIEVSTRGGHTTIYGTLLPDVAPVTA